MSTIPPVLQQLLLREYQRQRLQWYKRNSKYAKPPPQDGYQTKLTDKEKKEFNEWVKKNNVPYEDSPWADYDMPGFWKAMKAGDPNATSAIDPNDKQIHYPDYWKTPYAKTFSNESQWATKKAPHWNDKDQLVMPDGTVIYDDRVSKDSG